MNLTDALSQSVNLPCGSVSRRQFFGATTTAALAAVTTQALGQVADSSQAFPAPLVDVNANLSRWPCRRLPCDETPKLVSKFSQSGVTAAWTGTLDGLFHKDVRAANERLADECRRAGQEALMPFGSINPTLPDWQEDCRLCAEKHKMRGIRLHPNYHGYQLDAPCFKQVMAIALQFKLVVQIAIRMEDERMMHPLMRVKPVDASPLLEALPQWASVPVVLLNAFGSLSNDDIIRLLAMPNAYADIATLEGVGAIEQLLADVSYKKLLFGTHSPIFYFESAVLKLVESNCASTPMTAICRDNASHILTSVGEPS